MSQEALNAASIALIDLQTQLNASILMSDKMPEPFRSNVAAHPIIAGAIVNLAKEHIVASEEEKRGKKKLNKVGSSRNDLDLAMVDLAVYIATLTEAIVRPLLLIGQGTGEGGEQTIVIDNSTLMQVEAFRWELEYVQHQLEQFINRRTTHPQPIWGKLLGKGAEEDAKDALHIGGLSSRIQKVVTVYQLETNVALRAQVDGLRKEMQEMIRPSRLSTPLKQRSSSRQMYLTPPKAGDSASSLDGSGVSPRDRPPMLPPKSIHHLRPVPSRGLPVPPGAVGDRQSGAISITLDSSGNLLNAEEIPEDGAATITGTNRSSGHEAGRQSRSASQAMGATTIDEEDEPEYQEESHQRQSQQVHDSPKRTEYAQSHPEEDEPRAPSMTALQMLFPDVDASLLAAVANHTLAAADLYKLSGTSPFGAEFPHNVMPSNGSIRSRKAGSGVGTSTYPTLTSIIQPLTTYFAILIRTVPPHLAPSLGAATMQYLGDLRDLAERYEWYAVLQYHFAVWRRRRQEMGEEDEYGGWGRREEDLVIRYLEGHPKRDREHRGSTDRLAGGGIKHKRSSTTPAAPGQQPQGLTTHKNASKEIIGRTPTIISQTMNNNVVGQQPHKRGSTTLSKRSSKGVHRDRERDNDNSSIVTRVYSIGSCPACGNGRMNSCKVCEGRNSLPLDHDALEYEGDEDYLDGFYGGVGGGGGGHAHGRTASGRSKGGSMKNYAGLGRVKSVERDARYPDGR